MFQWAIGGTKPEATPKILGLLLNAGFPPSSIDNDKMTPLHILAYHDPAELDYDVCLQDLLKFRAPLELRDRYNRTPLLAAQASAVKYSNDYSLAVSILENGASAAGCVREQLQATFFTAVLLGKAKAVEELIKVGANADARNEDDKTAFNLAEECSREDVLEVLRKAPRGKRSGNRDHKDIGI